MMLNATEDVKLWWAHSKMCVFLKFGNHDFWWFPAVSGPLRHNFQAFRRTAAQKQICLSGTKHSPPSLMSSGPEGRNRRLQHFQWYCNFNHEIKGAFNRDLQAISFVYFVHDSMSLYTVPRLTMPNDSWRLQLKCTFYGALNCRFLKISLYLRASAA